MKHLILLSALAFAPLLHAAEEAAAKLPTREELEKLGGFDPMPPDPADYNLHLDIQMISLPTEDALPLIEALRDEARIKEAVATLQVMLAKKKATLVGWPMVITKSGTRAVSESIDEIRYPTEFSFEGPEVAALKPEEKPAAPDAAAPAKKEDTVVAPYAFQTRNVGVTFEVEPVFDPQTKRFEIQLAPQHVSFTGFEKHVVETDGRKTIVEQPHFYTNKITTGLSVHDGDYVFLGAFRAAEPAGAMELFILHAKAKAVK